MMTHLKLIICNDNVPPSPSAATSDMYDLAWRNAVLAVELSPGVTVEHKLESMQRTLDMLIHQQVPSVFLSFRQAELRSSIALDALGITASVTNETDPPELFAVLYSPKKLREYKRVLSGISDERLAGMWLL